MSAPSAPQIVPRPRPTTTAIQFYWEPPASDGGSPVTKYTLANGDIAYSQDISANVATYTVTGLSAGIDYTFTLTATNINGTSSPATFRTVQVGTTTFGPTTATVSSVSATSALVSWNLSTVANSARTEWITIRCLPSTSAISSFVVTEYPYNFSALVEGLSTNITYRFLVQAVNDVGYCPPFAFTSNLTLVTQVFSPDQVTGLLQWLDATDTSYVSTTTVGGSNNVVERWFNKTNSNINIATRSNTTPYLRANQQNGLSTILMSNVYLTGTYGTTPTGEYLNAFFVGAHSASINANARALSFGQYGQSDNNNAFYLSAIERVSDTVYKSQRNGNNAQAATSVNTGTYHIVTMGQNNGSGIYGLNGSNPSQAVYSPQLSNFKISSFVIGNRPGFDTPWNGNIGELVVYNSNIPVSYAKRVEGYLAWKWGLTASLPDLHPYKSVQPPVVAAQTDITSNRIIYFNASTWNGSGAWTNEGSLGATYNATLSTGTRTKNAASNGVVFNGLTYYVLPNFGLQSQYTLSCWVKLTSTTNTFNGGSVFTEEDRDVVPLGRAHNMAIRANNSNLVEGFYWRFNGASNVVTSNASAVRNYWLNFAYTVSSINNGNSTLAFAYSNSVLLGSTLGTFSTTTNNRPYYIGARSDTYITNINLVGEIGEVSVYSRALTTAEIRQQYEYRWSNYYSP